MFRNYELARNGALFAELLEMLYCMCEASFSCACVHAYVL